MKIVYVAGPFRGANSWEIEQNVRRAEEAALVLWQAGAAVICPHANSRFFQGAAPDNVRLRGYLAILERSDALYHLPVSGSKGTMEEIRRAKELGLPVFSDLREAENWVRSTANVFIRVLV